MSQENTVSNFNDILKNLKDLTNTFVVESYVPSLGSSLTFKELNAKQQKLLLETLADDSLYKTQFAKQFYNILKENIVSNFDINSLSVFDKIFIGISLRNKISGKYNVVFSENPPYSEEVILENILNNFKNYKQPKPEQIKIVKNNTEICVELSIPSIIIESKYEEELYTNYKKVEDIKDSKEVGNILSNAFIGEISKYISKVLFSGREIEFSSLTVLQRIKLTEQLTGDIVQNILTKITEWKESVNLFITAESLDKKYTKVLSLDNLLFLS
jgi:hypothetical protein